MKERDAIEALLIRLAPACNLLETLASYEDGARLDIVFVVAEPLYEAESQVIPLVQQALALAQRLQPDFVVLPESVTPGIEITVGARHLYGRSSTTPRLYSRSRLYRYDVLHATADEYRRLESSDFQPVLALVRTAFPVAV